MWPTSLHVQHMTNDDMIQVLLAPMIAVFVLDESCLRSIIKFIIHSMC